MPSGRQFHRSTIRLKKENLKTSVLKRPFSSVASLFLILYLGVLKFTYDKMADNGRKAVLSDLKTAFTCTPALNSLLEPY